MNVSRKALTMICAYIILMLFLPTLAFAEGLDITITPDKTSYTSDETAVLTIDITNNTGMVVKNLKLTNYIPTGLQYVFPADAEKTIAEIQPGATARHTIRMRMIQIDMPQTGDSAQPILWMCMIFICGVFLMWRSGRRHHGK